MILLALLCAQCTPAQGDTNDDLGRTRYHMRQHLADLRNIQRLLVAGDLVQAQQLAYFFTRDQDNREIALAASSLARARTVEEAIRHEVRIGIACANCHQRAQTLPVFRAPSNAPRALPTVAAQMARHQWAVDRLWEGLIGASDEHWYVALYALANTVLPESKRPAPATLGVELRKLARAAREHLPPLTASQRADVYAEILVTCARCHAAQHQ